MEIGTEDARVLANERDVVASLPRAVPTNVTRVWRGACPNGVRHHRVNALKPDPNRRG